MIHLPASVRVYLCTAPCNNSAAGTVQPNTGQANDTNLATALTYSPFLGVATTAGPNTANATMTYDTAGRPLTAVAPSTGSGATGATTTYSYAFGTTVGGTIANGAYTTTATTNGHWTTAVADGLGRPATQTSGFGTAPGTTVSMVDTQYGPSACSPGGKMVKGSQPYAVAANEVWTSYAYDFLGRTVSVTAADGVSATKYSYQANWTTVTDPAGNWKQYESDAFGNVLYVVEPDPNAASPLTVAPASPSITAAKTLVTAYTYDGLNHLINVSMARGATTQTRTFAYDPVSLRLTSMTSPETGTAAAGQNPAANGTTSYTYNADGTAATRTDPKGQVTSYGYDPYQRLVLSSGSTAAYVYSYDADPISAYAQNAYGRLAAVQWGGGLCKVNGVSVYQYTEEYSYSPAGQVLGKRLTLNRGPGQTCTPVILQATLTYDIEGRVLTTTYPTFNGYAPLTATNSYDSMGRLTGVSDTEAGPAGCNAGTIGWASGAAYNAAGQLTGLQRAQPNQTPGACGIVPSYFSEAWTYNGLNQLTEIDTSAQSGGYPVGSASPGAATTFFAKYVFSATANNGQVTSAADSRTGKTATYGYDLLKRLTSATTASWSQTYSFDGFGNLASKSVPTGSAEPAFPGANPDKNWLNGAVYDANGNTLGLNGLGFLYDTENRMSAFATGSFYENYVYDESNHRVERSNNAGGANADLVYFYGPGGKLLATFEITLIGAPPGRYTATVQSERVYFGGMLLGQAGPDYSRDASTVTDRLGTAVPGYPYGTDIGTATGADQPDFATYTKEGASGLEYANQRYYSAGYGRFMTVDRYSRSMNPQNPGTLNRYAYVNGDSINSYDPTGRDGDSADNCVDLVLGPDGVFHCSNGDPVFQADGTAIPDPPAPDDQTIDLPQDSIQPYVPTIPNIPSQISINCDLTLGISPHVFNSPFNHTFLELTQLVSIVTGGVSDSYVTSNSYIDGVPATSRVSVVDPWFGTHFMPVNYLSVRIDSQKSAYPGQPFEVRSVPCNSLDQISIAAQTFPKGVLYGVAFSNSNTLTRYLLLIGGVLQSFDTPPFAIGWGSTFLYTGSNAQ